MTDRDIRLIVNADDYGYFPCVSRGIRAAAAAGRLTATGVLANSAGLDAQLAELAAVDVDVGVHLNLSFGRPLTAALAGRLAAWGGEFPAVGRMALEVLQRRVTLNEVGDEWRAQIAACGHGRQLWFLNSHQHIHMLPPLFPLARELAAEFAIPHLRLTRAEWLPGCGFAGLLRNLLLQGMHTVNNRRLPRPQPLLLGLAHSGRLQAAGLRQLFRRLKPGGQYELMCHPGYFDAAQIADPGLIAYHDWAAELALLLGAEFRDLLTEHGIRLAYYRNLDS